MSNLFSFSAPILHMNALIISLQKLTEVFNMFSSPTDYKVGDKMTCSKEKTESGKELAFSVTLLKLVWLFLLIILIIIQVLLFVSSAALTCF